MQHNLKIICKKCQQFTEIQNVEINSPTSLMTITVKCHDEFETKSVAYPSMDEAGIILNMCQQALAGNMFGEAFVL